MRINREVDVSDYGERHRPPKSSQPAGAEPEGPRRAGASIEADRKWAQNRIRNHIAANGGVIFRMPKWRGGQDAEESRRSEKGKTFRGGKKKDRDNWYGFDDPDFQSWWHRVGKQEFGHGMDLDNREQAQAAHQYWVQQGKPRAGK